MLVFAVSDKGGTGRSVTSCNIVYSSALNGHDACYLDFDFGSPTAGSIFQIADATRGVAKNGLHSFLHTGTAAEPRRIDIWRESARVSLRNRPSGAGRLTLIPGDADGGEFGYDHTTVERCVKLFLRLEEEFDLCLVDLSAGRSYATQLVLEATADPRLGRADVRWLVFHRWTRQHIPAAAGLVFGNHGILATGTASGHNQNRLLNAIRFVRTAVVDPSSGELSGLRASQIAWLHECDQDLSELAAKHQIGRAAVLGSVPLDPVLQWREQLLSDNDVFARDIANRSTVSAFDELAKRLTDDAWESP